MAELPLTEIKQLLGNLERDAQAMEAAAKTVSDRARYLWRLSLKIQTELTYINEQLKTIEQRKPKKKGTHPGEISL